MILHLRASSAIKTSGLDRIRTNSLTNSLLLSIVVHSLILCDKILIASSTIVSRPSSGKATLIPGQNLNFQCSNELDANAQFLWYWKKIKSRSEDLIEPGSNDHFDIHNNRLTLVNPSMDLVGDYYCKQIADGQNSSSSSSRQTIRGEKAAIRVRTKPYIEDFGIETSHTGQSTTISDGDRLELICNVYDKITPVNITWLRSITTDDDESMIILREGDIEITTTEPPGIHPFNMFEDPFYPQTHFVGRNQHGIEIQSMGPFSKKLIIESVSQEHRSYYACVADNGITERTKKLIFIRVKDRLIALWPFLGILAEFFILFTIIKIWETQRFNFTYGASSSTSAGAAAAAAGPSSRPLLAGGGSGRGGKGPNSSR